MSSTLAIRPRHRCGEGQWAVGTCASCAPISTPRVGDSRYVLGSPVVWLGAVGLLGLLFFPRVRTALSPSRFATAAAPAPILPLEDLL